MITSCFFIPVASGDLQRVSWTVQSIRKFCNDFRIYLLLDMKPGIKLDQSLQGEDIEILYPPSPSNRHWGSILRMICKGMLHALQRPDLSQDCIFVKMDADALLVRPGFVKRAQNLFDENLKCGQLGQVFTNISGMPLDNKGWINYFNRRMSMVGHVKAFGLFLQNTKNPLKSIKYTYKLRDLLVEAKRKGYKLGTFAIGGTYILRRQTVLDLRARNWLDDSPFFWWPKPEEDVMITPHIYATGYTAMDDVENDGLFAICGKESWIHPLELAKQGYYFIHPIKYGVTKFHPRMSEPELVKVLLSE